MFVKVVEVVRSFSVVGTGSGKGGNDPGAAGGESGFFRTGEPGVVFPVRLVAVVAEVAVDRGPLLTRKTDLDPIVVPAEEELDALSVVLVEGLGDGEEVVGVKGDDDRESGGLVQADGCCVAFCNKAETIGSAAEEPIMG